MKSTFSYYNYLKKRKIRLHQRNLIMRFFRILISELYIYQNVVQINNFSDNCPNVVDTLQIPR